MMMSQVARIATEDGDAGRETDRQREWCDLPGNIDCISHRPGPAGADTWPAPWVLRNPQHGYRRSLEQLACILPAWPPSLSG